MVIKTNFQEGTYFVDSITRKESERFIPSPKLCLLYTNPKTGIQKPMSNVYMDNRTDVIIAKDVNGSTYVVDDGYRNNITRAGYIVYNNYDQEHIEDKDIGIDLHTKIKEFIRQAIYSIYPNIEFYTTDFNQRELYKFEKNGYRFTIVICDNIYIVKKNEERKINGLQFFPFDKNMDNYGTVYCAIYAQKIENTEENPRTISDNILKDIVNKIDNIKFVPMIIKQPLYFTLKD